ncbi:hypothetical protein N9992_00710 [bacterium]|nr:hypothetical protein [bacterium]
MDNVNHLLEGASPYKVLSEQSAKLAGKWEKSGLLEGIESSTEKNNMSMLLENQAKQLVNEANSLSTDASFSAGNSEAWAGVALPLVRRVFGEIVAKDLVSVQPMNLPAGLIFYLDFQYGNDNAGFGATDSLYGASADLKKTELPTAGNNKALYGAGTYGYSINDVTALSTNIEAVTHAGATLSATSASAQPLTVNDSASVNYDADFIASVALGDVDELRVSTASIADFDPEAVRSYIASGCSITANYNQFNSYTAGNGYVSMFVADAAVGTDLVVKYAKGPDNLNDRGDFEDGNTTTTAVSSLDIPTIDVQLRSDTVAAKTRKLKAQWTPEFAQDLNAYHSIDAEAELTSILSEYISMEIDLEILDMLIQNADTTAHWSADVSTEVSDSGVKSSAAANTVYYTKMSWFQTLGVKLQKVSNLIHQKTLRGGANFMVVSPKVSTILESIPGFAADSAGDADKYAMGVQKVGAINSRYTVYKNPYMTENTILMGYKGSQFLETGAVFAPYIPLIMTPLVYDPISFTPRKGIMTRYAKKMVRPDFYGKVICHDLNLV